MEEFAESFTDADQVLLTDIYLAREAPREGVTGASLAALTADRRGADCVTYIADKSALPGRIAEIARSGDIVLTLGAGHDIRDVAEAYLKTEFASPDSLSRLVSKVGGTAPANVDVTRDGIYADE